MIRGRRGEQWVRSFHSAPWVSYAEALCWVYYRDVASISELGIVRSDRDYAEMGTGMVEALLAMEAGLEEWQSAAPELAFLDALESGAIAASGHPFVLLQLGQGSTHAKIDRRKIEPVEWLDIRFYDAPAPFDKATTVYPRALLHGAKASAGFTDIWFSRADLTKAFPGEGANQVIHLASVRDEPALTTPSQTDYMRSRAALVSAVEELEAEGVPAGKLAILRKVANAFHAAGYAKRGQTAASVFASMKARSVTLGLTREAMLMKAGRG